MHKNPRKDSAPPSERQSGGGLRAFQLGIALTIGLVLGGILGRATAPTPPPASLADADAAQAHTPRVPDEGPRVGAIGGLMDQAESFMDSEVGGKLAAVSGIVRKASLLDWARSPEDVSRRIIHEMSDDELVATITSITRIGEEDLAEVSDLRGYANRLSEIALSGVITPELSAEFADVHVPVQFATRASSSNGAEDAGFVFAEDTRKIYAVIPNSTGIGENVMVHWYQVDQPRNLLFDRYRVSPQDDYSYVWLKADDRWKEGEYRVEFFSADENLTPIASGTYRVLAD